MDDEEGLKLEPVILERGFDSEMTEFHQGSDIDSLLINMYDHIKKKIENPKLTDSEFKITRDTLYTY